MYPDFATTSQVSCNWQSYLQYNWTCFGFTHGSFDT